MANIAVKIVELTLRLIVPVALILVGLALLWYGLRLVGSSQDAQTGWAIVVPSVVTLVLGIIVLVLSNTRKARRRWRSD